jgi:CHASE3 domain sensor protein
MKLTRGAKRIAGGLVLLVLVLLAGYLNFYQRVQVIDARNPIIHMYEVSNQLQAVDASLKDGATGQRVYLTTLDERYLEPYSRATAGIKMLQALTTGDASHHQRINALSAKVNEEVADLRSTVKARPTQSERSKAFTADINDIITEIGTEQNQRLCTQMDTLTLESDKTFKANGYALDSSGF